MSSTMLNWPELWEREPELRPRDEDWELHAFNDPEGIFGTLFQWRAVGESEMHYENPVVAAALCRDAAVRWLANVGHQTLLIDCVGDDQWYINPGMCEDACSATADGFDAALFAACRAVLDAWKSA